MQLLPAMFRSLFPKGRSCAGKNPWMPCWPGFCAVCPSPSRLVDVGPSLGCACADDVVGTQTPFRRAVFATGSNAESVKPTGSTGLCFGMSQAERSGCFGCMLARKRRDMLTWSGLCKKFLGILLCWCRRLSIPNRHEAAPECFVDRTGQGISVCDLPTQTAFVPLCSHLFSVCSRSIAEVRTVQGRVVGTETFSLLPSLGREWLRPSSLRI
jgi:hypothetical protein